MHGSLSDLNLSAGVGYEYRLSTIDDYLVVLNLKENSLDFFKLYKERKFLYLATVEGKVNLTR